MTNSPCRGRAEADPAVAVHSLTKIFPVPLHPARAIVAVKDLNLRIEPGEVFGLLGPNGSGKTTSLKAAAGLLRPSAGAILVGNPLRTAADPAARQATAFLPQRVAFPDALTGGLRRSTDALRAVLERTRGDVTTALVAARLRRAVDGAVTHSR